MRPITIGTRGSPLALAQARMTAAALSRALGRPEADFPLLVLTTTGDSNQDRALAEIGGKGLFTKEIDAAQLDRRVDIAVHSAKDLPTELPDGLVLAGTLPRADTRDALIAPRHGTLAALPVGARVGSVSLRRQALLRRVRPDLRVETLRGNVGTRLDKAASGEFDAVVLACAGLERLGLAGRITEILDAERFVPAVGQGAIALVARAEDAETRAAITAIGDAGTFAELRAERAFLAVLDGSCRTPIGGRAVRQGNALAFHGIVLEPDGARGIERHATGLVEAPEVLGRTVGEALRSALPPDFRRG